ncbi:flagellar hook-associated protein FlgK [Paraburkholderia phenazinium]|uniref:Flagellar hook-associated protein 1 n=1 Tax=Paraburkholderia phenazinium TaxID=60549 RepID=A0A1N6L7R7_9BURK|nr:flagellar hook-associated protein FlgK [Paraburkholderia phenazinium]SIO64795.1 flagellar hook-associated protein 1 FlgK [Paraburkholderia phenazinium]
MSSNLINIGLSGLNAAQWGLNTTSENISNSATPGYDVESPVYAEASGQYTGSGYLPQGVNTTTVQRAYSQYLTTELNNAQSQSGSLSTNYTMLAQLNNLVGSPTSGISTAITSYFTGLQTVSSNASNLATRQTAVSDAQTLATELNTVGSQYAQLGQSVNTQLASTVAQINTYTTQIASLNQQINAASSQGQPPNQLLDQRDQAISSLSSLVGVQVVSNSTGDSVFLPSGQTLVSGTTSYNLGTAPSPANSAEMSVTYLGAAGTTPTAATTQYLSDSTMQSVGGSLGGLVTFRSQSLDPAEAQLGAIATSFAAQVNNQNELGLTLSGSTGGALFSVAPPAANANANNTGTAALSVSFVNATQPTTSNYTLSYNGSTYTLTDNQSGDVVGSASNLSAPIDGLNFSMTGTMNAGDSFNVSPTSGALTSFALTTTRGSAIAAASPVLATASSANSGTATITEGTVSAGYSLPATTTTLTYNSTSGGLTGFPVGSVVTINGTSTPITTATTVVPYSPASGATMTINTTPATAGSMNGITVTLSGTPANNDTFTIAANTGAQSDGRNATLMSNIVSAQTLNGGTTTLTTAYANYVNTVGNTTNSVNASNTTQTALVTQITSAQQSVSGVNVNEEAANLLQYQQLYQANSKVIQTADTLFQTILGIFS